MTLQTISTVLAILCPIAILVAVELARGLGKEQRRHAAADERCNQLLRELNAARGRLVFIRKAQELLAGETISVYFNAAESISSAEDAAEALTHLAAKLPSALGDDKAAQTLLRDPARLRALLEESHALLASQARTSDEPSSPPERDAWDFGDDPKWWTR